MDFFVFLRELTVYLSFLILSVQERSMPKNWWTEEETALLITLWRDDAIFSQVASTRTRSKKVYDSLSERLKNVDVHKTPQQIRSKLKNLKSEYKKEKDHNNRSGRERKTSKYYDVLDEVLGGRPSVDPPNVEETLLDDSDHDTLPDDTDEAELEAEGQDESGIVEDAGAELHVHEREETEDVGGAAVGDDGIATEGFEGGQGAAEDADNELTDGQVHVQQAPTSRKRKGSPRREHPKRRDRTLKEAMDKILTVSREQDQAFRQDAMAARQQDERTSREELDTLKQMIELSRMQMEFQREEAARREKREEEDRKRENRKWDLFFSNMSSKPWPAAAHTFPQMTGHMPPHPTTQQPPEPYGFPPGSQFVRPRAPSTFTPLASSVHGLQSRPTWPQQPPRHPQQPPRHPQQPPRHPQQPPRHPQQPPRHPHQPPSHPHQHQPQHDPSRTSHNSSNIEDTNQEEEPSYHVL